MKEHNGRAENVALSATTTTENSEPTEVRGRVDDEHQHRPAPVAPRRDYETPQAAAVRLGLDVQALRARCRRAAKKVGNDVVAHLGGGIVAVKLGSSWRIRFPAG
jgi:hypothetical protein